MLIACSLKDLSSQGLQDAILDEIHKFRGSGEPVDDLTLLVVKALWPGFRAVERLRIWHEYNAVGNCSRSRGSHRFASRRKSSSEEAAPS